jgi:hypothetical protein
MDPNIDQIEIGSRTVRLNDPIRPPQDVRLYHPDDEVSARLIISLSNQPGVEVILQHITRDGQEATVVCGGSAARCMVKDLQPI